MINLLQPSIPELGAFAKDDESKGPNLWNGLVACWAPSLGVTGMELKDVSGHNIDGTLINMDIDDWAISGNPRNPGYALDFDGVTQYVDCGNISSTIFSGDFTVIVELYVDKATVPTKFIAGKGSGPNDGLELMIRNSGAIETQLDGNRIFSSDGVVPARTWFQAAFVRKGSDVDLYINSTNVGSGSNSNNSSGTSDFHIGQVSYDPGVTPWLGFIGETSIYERALSLSEIIDKYQYASAMFEFADRWIWGTPVVGSILRNPNKNFINNLITR